MLLGRCDFDLDLILHFDFIWEHYPFSHHKVATKIFALYRVKLCSNIQIHTLPLRLKTQSKTRAASRRISF